MTAFAHPGLVLEEDTEDQLGSPEREIEVTSQPRATANLQMREPGVLGAWSVGGFEMEGLAGTVPRNPLPPQTTTFFGGTMVLERGCFICLETSLTITL